jgi:uncharacterized protein
MGYAWAMSNLGWLYEQGLGVAQDYLKVVEWYEKAAAHGDGWGMCLLGCLYEMGRGVAQDFAKAQTWFDQTKKRGMIVVRPPRRNPQTCGSGSNPYPPPTTGKS